jgi:ATP synthase protein I
MRLPRPFCLDAIMTEPGDKPTDDRFKDFEQRLDETLANRDDKAGPDPTDTMAAGFALRAITEILVALAVCTIAGYYLDRWLGTTPWMMIILMPLGQMAGIWNVMRLSRSKQADAILGNKGPVPPAVNDDDDED